MPRIVLALQYKDPEAQPYPQHRFAPPPAHAMAAMGITAGVKRGKSQASVEKHGRAAVG